jgi:transcriptional regulator with XRE-family HTH domain
VGRLITSARLGLGISQRDAARRAGISEGHWRQITSGYQAVAPGRYSTVRGTARTVAAMAAVVGLSPEQLDQASRPDAASVLRAMRGAPTAAEVLRDLDVRITTMPPDEAKILLSEIGRRLSGDAAPPEEDRRRGFRRYGT